MHACIGLQELHGEPLRWLRLRLRLRWRLLLWRRLSARATLAATRAAISAAAAAAAAVASAAAASCASAFAASSAARKRALGIGLMMILDADAFRAADVSALALIVAVISCRAVSASSYDGRSDDACAAVMPLMPAVSAIAVSLLRGNGHILSLEPTLMYVCICNKDMQYRYA